MDIAGLFAGLGLLLAGGSILVRGASDLAKSLGVSSLVIGLTVVAFGTSAPELAVNLLASYDGNTDISFGNIIGSNIANIGLILGLAALIKPLTISSAIITREIPMMVLASVVVLILASDQVLKMSPNGFDRSDGLIFLMVFSVFMYYTVSEVFRNRNQDSLITQAEASSGQRQVKKTLISLVYTLVGLVLLIAGGKISVSNATNLAQSLGIPQVIIALTVVAIGTSLPELITSLIATWKGQTDLAIGNVVGSNIFNLLLINGVSASYKTIPLPTSGGFFDLYVMIFLSVLLLMICITDQKRIVRWEGGLLLGLYLAYSVIRVTWL
ncbi:MAG: calcium/sodium antiporter [Proteobacteria bacterium]|nr:calcium/sodium antiporter [Pseudomonadota bacterium]